MATSTKETSTMRSQDNKPNQLIISQNQTSKFQKRYQFSKLSNESWRFSLLLIILLIAIREYWLTSSDKQLKCFSTNSDKHQDVRQCFILPASSHIVLTRDDNGQSLVLTGEDGKGGKGGKGGGGDQLVIAGDMGGSGGGGGGQNSNMVLQDAANREGDVVISGHSMVVPGEDGHIVLADNRARDGGGNGGASRGPPPNLFAFWMPYMYNRFGYRSMTPQFFGGGLFGK